MADVSDASYSYSFNVPDVSATTFYIVVAVLLLATIFLALYNGLFVFYFGRPMRKYLTARLTAMSGILQVFEHENLYLHLAGLIRGGVFIDREDERVKPVIPKSVVTVNGVPTTLVWNLTPKLPDVYIAALERIIEWGYNTVDEIKEDLESGFIQLDDKILEKMTVVDAVLRIKYKRELLLISALATSTAAILYSIGTRALLTFLTSALLAAVLFLILVYVKRSKAPTSNSKPEKAIAGDEHNDKYTLTYAEFLAIHGRVKARNTIEVTVSDVLDFNTKFLDEHAKTSLIERLMNVEKKKMREKKYQKWGFIIIGVLVLGGLLLKAYMVLHGSPPAGGT